MKIGLASDVHTELGLPQNDMTLPERVDVMLLAGDIGKGPRAVRWALDTFGWQSGHIVMIAGNHEFYGGCLQSVMRKTKEYAAQFPNVTYLDNEYVDINGVRFVGSTAWTDFTYGSHDVYTHMAAAQGGMNDYRKIKYLKGSVYRKLLAQDTRQMNADAKNFLFKTLAESDRSKTVVMTHHAPTHLSLNDRYAGDILNAAYCSNWGWDVADFGPKLWVHGHVHIPVDYEVGDTRVVANPIGYPGENLESRPQVLEF